jgi:hypothetical protein
METSFTNDGSPEQMFNTGTSEGAKKGWEGRTGQAAPSQEEKAADILRYQQLKTQLSEAARHQSWTKFFDLQKEAEALKNKYGGLPPK